MCLEKDVLNKIKHTSLSQHFSQVLEWPWSTLIHYRSRNWNSGWSQMALRALFKSNGLSLCFLAYISLASYLLLLLRNWRMKAIKMWKKNGFSHLDFSLGSLHYISFTWTLVNAEGTVQIIAEVVLVLNVNKCNERNREVLLQY